MASVSIRNLSFGFGAKEIISNLDLEVTEGEFLVLLGPSGCGKSTLLHCIAGLNDIDGGVIEIGGQDMTWVDPSQRNIGMVFQSYALYPTMTVERNMSFSLRVKGMPAAEIERRVWRAAEILHLEPLLKRKPSQLSGGQRQRVAIGRALVREAGVFLFDEPLSNLDAKLRAELRRELMLLHKRLRATIIYVTHDQVEAMTLASRIVVMRNGRIQQAGAPDEVYSRPENLFVGGFLGAPGMNFIKGEFRYLQDRPSLVAEGLALDLSGYAFRQAPGEGRAIVLGIRPEYISLDPEGLHQGNVVLVESMGNHQIVWLSLNGAQVAVLRHGAVEQALGCGMDQPIRFNIDVSRVSLFDQGSERRI